MPKRVVKHSIFGLERDGKPWVPPVGEEVDLSQEELDQIEQSNPRAVSLPVDRNKDKTPTVTAAQNPSDRLANAALEDPDLQKPGPDSPLNQVIGVQNTESATPVAAKPSGPQVKPTTNPLKGGKGDADKNDKTNNDEL